LAVSHFANAISLLTQPNVEHRTVKILNNMADCYRAESLVARFFPDWKSKLCGIVKQAFKNTNDEMCELDKNARICYVNLGMDSWEHLLTFIKCSLQKYPEEKTFHRLLPDICGFLFRHDEALNGIENGLKLFPDDVGLLYSRGVHLRQSESRANDEVIEAYEKFLSVAPKDHHKIPESYYAIGNEYFYKLARTYSAQKETRREELEHSFRISKVEEYYQLGLQAEDIQLPDFLPYKCGQKPIIENNLALLKMNKLKTTPETPNNETTFADSQVAVEPDYVLLTDPNRLRAIRSHREDLASRPKLIAQATSMRKTTINPSNSQPTSRKTTGLNPISFRNMDTMVDKVFEGNIINVTSIEDAAVGAYPSIRLALEDDNGDVWRAFVYNFPDQDKKVIQQKLGFGAKFCIVNPYMRLGHDGLFGIRVDDPASIIMHSPRNSSRCRFFGHKEASKHCGNCKWAHYCNPKCQQMDWKLLKHKLVCRPV